MSSTCPQHVLNMSSTCPQHVLNMSSTCPQHVFNISPLSRSSINKQSNNRPILFSILEMISNRSPICHPKLLRASRWKNYHPRQRTARRLQVPADHRSRHALSTQYQ
ncbi:hypothetical protein RRG08_024108 [Elysia crispata]|uniref:Uncharacterized protein n=1 Tax=Elysia crispata TaxID=231223 RepID=A0AAE1BD78_9GAST|nr:hypothetical protein RRG08_024108 [Elysia crispata]